ncbi:MAG: PilZ domain-containing protein [Nitrospirota bacterium]|nr:PilZ domain-containing protein [Nitrospirota bacterium]
MYIPNECRQALRLAVDCPVEYRTIEVFPIITGHGVVLDLSEEGCRIRGLPGMVLGLSIELLMKDAEGTQSTMMNNCRVTWVKDEEFGVQFLW